MSCLRKGSITKETFREGPEGSASAGHADLWGKGVQAAADAE